LSRLALKLRLSRSFLWGRKLRYFRFHRLVRPLQLIQYFQSVLFHLLILYFRLALPRRFLPSNRRALKLQFHRYFQWDR